MFKSVLGITLANFISIFIIAQNNVGPGWEVPVNTMQSIYICSFLLFASIVFALICFLLSIKQFKKTSGLFKIIYLLDAIICLSAVSFIFTVEGFQGQFWYQYFPLLWFLLISISLNIILFIYSIIWLYGFGHKKED